MTTSPRTRARSTGILYLVTHVTSIGAVAAYASGAIALGATLEFVLALACAGTGVLLWTLLSSAGAASAAAFAVLRAVEAAVILAGLLPLVGTVLVPGSSTDAAISVHAAAFLVGQGLVIAVNTVVLGSLLWTSRAVPRALAALALVGGAIVLLSDLAQLWTVIPLNGALAAAAALPIFAFEIWFAIRLIVVGVQPRAALSA
ncbi:DUF4386 domain-containing protein [Microbacterium sp. SLBN-111]|uniref:DUF4386 domain-containing protein n=1 Tax=Microbacterium sp. SLBN-111 TaxID=3377733 RepID=UPI003C76AF23